MGKAESVLCLFNPSVKTDGNKHPSFNYLFLLFHLSFIAVGFSQRFQISFNN